MHSPSHIILVRTPIDPIEHDPYHCQLATTPQSTLHHLPVLHTTFLNPATLQSILATGPQGSYSGVVITSGRAVEAWARVTTDAIGRSNTWDALPFFVVGKGTRDAVLRLPHPPPAANILASETTGSGYKLASFILSYFPTPPPLPLLYLVGDKNRDTIPRMLAGAGIGLAQVQVYETRPDTAFEQRLDSILESIRTVNAVSGTTIWIALFSPSGAQHCLEILRQKNLELRSSTCLDDEGESEGRVCVPMIKLAGIGPTTRAYVVEEEGLWMHAVANSPDPQDLIKALREG